jgi:DNA polymerase V
MNAHEKRRRARSLKSSIKFSKLIKVSPRASDRENPLKDYALPFYQTPVSAGFPSPAEDYIEDKLDLNDLLIQHPTATFFLKVSGNSMIKAGIHHGDILIVDRSLRPSNGKIVIASINGELTVKRLKKIGEKVYLAAENDTYKPFEITSEEELVIWGVVTRVIHSV